MLELTKNNIQYGHKDNLNRTPLDVAFDVSKRIDDGRKPELQQIIDKLSIYRYEWEIKAIYSTERERNCIEGSNSSKEKVEMCVLDLFFVDFINWD